MIYPYGHEGCSHRIFDALFGIENKNIQIMEQFNNIDHDSNWIIIEVCDQFKISFKMKSV